MPRKKNTSDKPQTPQVTNAIPGAAPEDTAPEVALKDTPPVDAPKDTTPCATSADTVISNITKTVKLNDQDFVDVASSKADMIYHDFANTFDERFYAKNNHLTLSSFESLMMNCNNNILSVNHDLFQGLIGNVNEKDILIKKKRNTKKKVSSSKHTSDPLKK
jgi:hypothetical protein